MARRELGEGEGWMRARVLRGLVVVVESEYEGGMAMVVSEEIVIEGIGEEGGWDEEKDEIEGLGRGCGGGRR